LNCALHLKEEGKEYRTLKLYGQEINLLTSAIARMNMFMHGIEEFDIVRGDTLANPGLLENDELKKFNVILANPPYSIKSWDRKSFENDSFGRNIWGTPPQGCADYAFQQHIQKSLDTENGRSITLWPNGVLFRDSETDIRRKMIEDDIVECVIGLGPNLFYNSSMTSCLLVTNNNKAQGRKEKTIFIQGVNCIRKEGTMSYLDSLHIDEILRAFKTFEDQEGFCKVVTKETLLLDPYARLSIDLHVDGGETDVESEFAALLSNRDF
jgi:type I restriction enzyme M protein